MNIGTLRFSRLDVRHDTLEGPHKVISHNRNGEVELTHIELELRDLGSLVGGLAERVADLNRLDLRSELFKEFVVNSRLHEDTATGTATLAVVPANQIA